MLTSDSTTLICDALVRGTSKLPDNKLAYLALTSKPELQIRDELAWTLHRQLGGDAIVAREWTYPGQVGGGRIDLAVLDEEAKPKVLVELKSFMTFNALRPKDMDRYRGYLKRDIDRVGRLGTDADAIGILISVHAATEVRAGLDRVVKYRTDINRALKKFGAEELWNEAHVAIQRSLGQLGPVKHTEIGSGTAFEIKCRLDAYVVTIPR